MPRRRRTRPRRARVRILTFNVHVGFAVVALVWLLTRFPGVHIVCLQEVQRPWAKRAVRRAMPSKKWTEVSSSTPMVGTMIFARRHRFRLTKQAATHLSRGVSGVHPVRELVTAAFLDLVTRRVVDVSCLHAWAMAGGLAKARDNIRDGHVRQVAATAAHHAAQPDENVQAAAADWNEDIDAKVPDEYTEHTARRQMAAAGMLPAAHLAPRGSDRGLHYDEVFVAPSPHTRVVGRRVIRPPFRKADHPAVLVTLAVKPLRK